jgi:hypothetical protein
MAEGAVVGCGTQRGEKWAQAARDGNTAVEGLGYSGIETSAFFGITVFEGFHDLGEPGSVRGDGCERRGTLCPTSVIIDTKELEDGGELPGNSIILHM